MAAGGAAKRKQRNQGLADNRSCGTKDGEGSQGDAPARRGEGTPRGDQEQGANDASDDQERGVGID